MQKLSTRRQLLLAGGGLVGVGGVAGCLSRDNPTQLGSDGLTAQTAPAAVDSLFFIRGTQATSGVRAATGLAGDTPGFGSIQLDVEPKTLFVRTGPATGGAVVWADWDTDRLEAVVKDTGSGSLQTKTHNGRRTFITGDTAGVALGDTVFSVGASTTVRSVLDVWHGDGDPLGDEVLSGFDLTHRDAPVRFTLQAIDVSCGCLTETPRSDNHDAIGRVRGSVSADSVISVAAPTGAPAQRVADRLRADLGLTDAAPRVELPASTSGAITVKERSSPNRVKIDADLAGARPSVLQRTLSALVRLLSG